MHRIRESRCRPSPPLETHQNKLFVKDALTHVGTGNMSFCSGPVAGPGTVLEYPLLPSGWTEHQAPTGHAYYFHAQTNQSTYIRPVSISSSSEMSPAIFSKPSTSKGKKKQSKDRPKEKTIIPGSSWARIRTVEGNTFYYHTERKESVWEIPSEVEKAVQDLEMREEADRVIAEVQESTASLNVDVNPEPETEGLVADAMEVDSKMGPEGIDSSKTGSKTELPKEYDMPEQVRLSADEAKALFKTLLHDKDVNPMAPFNSVISTLVTDHRYVLLPSVADRETAFNEYCLEKTRAMRAAKAAVPAKGAADEKLTARASYDKLLVDELKSTRTTWDEFRKKWRKDRRFFAFGKDDREREKIFKEYRKDLSEIKRQAAQKAEAAFFALLRENENLGMEDGEEPSWKDVKAHKAIHSDPRYEAVGSSSLREELFAVYLKARNPNAQTEQTVQPSPGPSAPKGPKESTEEAKKRARQERAERATRDRAEQVRRQMETTEIAINRTRGQLSDKEDIESFLTLLTDAIREPTANYGESVSLLSRSPVFNRSQLPEGQKRSLFDSHIKKLQDKQLVALHALFEAHTPQLNDRFEDLPDSIYRSLPAQKLDIGKPSRGDRISEHRMRRLWEDWQGARLTRARVDFDKLLEENQFVGFWAGVKRMTKDSKGGDGTIVPGVDAAEEDEDEDGEEGGGKADLKALAKAIGEKQIEDVLKHDKRFKVWDHAPEDRERWIQDYLGRLAAPKLSVHVGD